MSPTDSAFDQITKATDEVLTADRLRDYLTRGIPLKHYIGLEISGEIHLGSGLMCMGKVADFQRAGVACSVFLADWHSWINDKLGGDRAVIREMAEGYFKHGLAASLRCCGGDPEQVNWVLGSELYHHNDSYWETVVDVCRNVKLNRMMRSITILGREENEGVEFAKLLYPALQVADIFAQGITLAHAGMDQRKAHVVAIDVADKLSLHPLMSADGERLKPIAVHHPLILGLGKPPELREGETLREARSRAKMSKSKPETAVFIHDSPDAIRKKLKKAYCLTGDVDYNPILDWAEKLLFRREGFALEITRPEKFGGNLSFASYETLKQTFADEGLHPMDLKNAVAEALIEVLAPARAAFEEDPGKGFLAQMQALKKTR